MVTAPRRRQPKFNNRSQGTLPFGLSGVLAQSRNHASQRQQALQVFKSTRSALGSFRGLRMSSRGETHLVLMYLPSRVRSLSEVAFSEPARSIKLCVWMLASDVNER